MRLSSLRHLRIVAMRDVWSNGTLVVERNTVPLCTKGETKIAGTRPPYRSKLKLYSRLNPGSFPSPQGGMAAGHDTEMEVEKNYVDSHGVIKGAILRTAPKDIRNIRNRAIKVNRKSICFCV
jgi:hypothetical protein